MYTIHHTEAIILGVTPIGESNAYYTLLTRDYGLLRASAQSVRKMDSRLRNTLVNFSYISLDLVLGKHVWRITSARPIASGLAFHNQYTLALFAQIAKLITRFIQGEESHEKIFSIVSSLHIFLQSHQHLQQKELYLVEVYVVASHLLKTLGYVTLHESLGVREANISFDSVVKISPFIDNLVSQINQALRESHL